MLSIETTKKILKRPNMSDEEAELIRDEMRTLAEIAVGMFISQKVDPKFREKLNNEIE